MSSYGRGYLLSYQSSDRTARIVTIHWKRIGLWRGHIELTTQNEQYHLENPAAASDLRYLGPKWEKKEGFSFTRVPKEFSMAIGVGDIGTNSFGFGMDQQRFQLSAATFLLRHRARITCAILAGMFNCSNA